MSASFGKLARDIVIYGGGDLLLKATALITLPIYTRVFPPEEYGVLSFVVTALGFLGAVLILGGDSAYARFFFEAKTLDEQRLVTSTWLGFLTLWSAAVVALCLPLTGWLSSLAFATAEYAALFALALVNAPLTLLAALSNQALRNQFRPGLYSALNLAGALLTVACNLVAVLVLEMGLAGMLAGTLAATLALLPVRLWAIRDQLRPVFSGRLLRGLLAYGVPLVPVSVAYWVFASSDRLVIAQLSTLEQLGLYAVAAALASALSFFTGAVGQAWTPHAMRVYEHDRERAPAFYGQVLTYLVAGFGLLCVGTTAFAPELVALLAAPAFAPAAAAVGPLVLAMLAHVTTQVTGMGIALTKRTHHFLTFSWVAALLNLGLNVLLVPSGGMIAASWTTTAAYVFLTLAYAVTSQRLFPVRYELRRSGLAVALVVAFTLAAPLLPALEWQALALKAGYCLAFAGLLVALKVIDGRELRPLYVLVARAHAARVAE